MKMNKWTKKKMAKQRLKRIIAYYRAHNEGTSMYLYEFGANCKLKKYYVSSKHQLNDSYYFVLSDEQGEISIFKIVYNHFPDVLEISKTSKKYLKNKDIFDSWIKELEDKE